MLIGLGICFIAGMWLHRRKSPPSDLCNRRFPPSRLLPAQADDELWLVMPLRPRGAAEPPCGAPVGEQVVRKSDNLSLIFQRAGFGKGDVYSVVSQNRRRQYPGLYLPGAGGRLPGGR